MQYMHTHPIYSYNGNPNTDGTIAAIYSERLKVTLINFIYETMVDPYIFRKT